MDNEERKAIEKLMGAIFKESDSDIVKEEKPMPIQRRINRFMSLEYWIETTPLSKFTAEIEKRIIGQPNVRLVCANVYAFLKAVIYNRQHSSNMMIAAPSGSGKTETYRALKDYFESNMINLPVLLIDTTQLTPAGYKGSNIDELFAPLLESGKEKPIALIFLDEFDKRIISQESHHGEMNQAVQQVLLSILEGSSISIRRMGVQTIKTDNILFFGLGSFDAFRKKITEKHDFGFERCRQKEDVYFNQIERNDLIDMGASYELIGRFPHLINYEPLTEEAIDRIVRKIIRETEETYDCNIIVTPDFMDEMHEMAASKYGCRSLRNKIIGDTLKTYSEAHNDACEDRLDKMLEITLGADMAVYEWVDNELSGLIV